MAAHHTISNLAYNHKLVITNNNRNITAENKKMVFKLSNVYFLRR